jgi:uncharacterized LabA/DUF88 family protein
MDRVAVFVDAGYVFAQGSRLLAGEKLTRSQVNLRHEAVVEKLRGFAEQIARVPLLRIYWYDGTSTGPTSQHLTLAHLADVKVRLGFVNTFGEQKGVDSLIVTDMIALARNGAMSDAVLLSGDEDVRVGVQQAQELGVRVHLLGIKPSRGSQSLLLMQEADTTHEWVDADVATFLSIRPREEAAPPEPAAAAGPPPPAEGPARVVRAQPGEGEADVYARVAVEVLTEVPLGERQGLILAVLEAGQLPREVDAKLLTRAARALGGILQPAQKRALRQAFRRTCERPPG